MKKTTVITALVLAVALITLTACSAASTSNNSAALNTAASAPQKNGEMYDDAKSYDTAMPEADYAANGDGFASDTGSAGNANTADISLSDPNRKLIRTASLEIETTEFDDSVAKIENMCLNYQGFVESSSVYGTSITARGKQYRSASYSFRIPSLRYNEFLNSLGTVGNVVNKTQNSQDVTDTYYDIESRLKILEMRRERLIGLLEKETNSKSIVEFENSLSDTLYEIERLTGSLKKYDSLVDYSTVSITLNEVEKYTEILPVTPEPESVGARIAKAFKDSAGAIGEFFIGLTVFVLGNILYLLIWAVVIAAAVIIVRKILIRSKTKNTDNSEGGGTNQQ